MVAKVDPAACSLLLPHDAAQLFPMMSPAEIEALAADIAANGQHEPIVMHEGLILDGRNRYQACQIADVDPKFVTWDGKGGSPTLFVLSLNAHRRHLTASQKAMVAAAALPLLEREAAVRKSEASKRGAATTNAKMGRVVAIVPPHEPMAANDGGPPAESRKARDDAAKAIGGVSPRYVQDAKALAESAPDLAAEVKAGTKTLPQAKREAREKSGDAPPPAPNLSPLAEAANALYRARSLFDRLERNEKAPDDDRRVAGATVKALRKLCEQVTFAMNGKA